MVNNMNEINVAHGMIFQKLKLSMSTYEDKIITMKKMYLLKSLGTDLNHTFLWYVRGPFSETLADYLGDNFDMLHHYDFSQYKLADEAEKNIKRVNGLLDDKKQGIRDEQWYEVLASLLYISNANSNQSWRFDGKEESLFETFMKCRPQYNQEICQQAYNTLCTRGFIENYKSMDKPKEPNLIKQLKNEHRS